jgi:hypothetical protein
MSPALTGWHSIAPETMRRMASCAMWSQCPSRSALRGFLSSFSYVFSKEAGLRSSRVVATSRWGWLNDSLRSTGRLVAMPKRMTHGPLFERFVDHLQSAPLLFQSSPTPFHV